MDQLVERYGIGRVLFTQRDERPQCPDCGTSLDYYMWANGMEEFMARMPKSFILYCPKCKQAKDAR